MKVFSEKKALFPSALNLRQVEFMRSQSWKCSICSSCSWLRNQRSEQANAFGSGNEFSTTEESVPWFWGSFPWRMFWNCRPSCRKRSKWTGVRLFIVWRRIIDSSSLGMSDMVEDRASEVCCMLSILIWSDWCWGWWWANVEIESWIRKIR